MSNINGLTDKFLKNSHYFNLLLSIVFFGSIFFVSHCTNYKSDSGYLANTIQERITDAELDLKRAVRDFYKGFDTLKSYPSFHSDLLFASDLESGDFFFLVYKNKQLVFWSNNKVPVGEDLLRNQKKNFFISRLQNGWYAFQQHQQGSFCFFGGLLIRTEYPLQNNFIKNEFSTWFNIPDFIRIEKRNGGYPIYSAEGTYLFSVTTDTGNKREPNGSTFILLLFLFGAGFLFLFIYQIYLGFQWLKNRRGLLLILFSLTILCLRAAQFYFRVPQQLYESEIFGPAWYASSAIMNSLGDFVINAFQFLFLAFVLFKNRKILKNEMIYGPVITTVSVFFSVLLVVFSFHTLTHFVQDVILNSRLPMNLQDIAALTTFSGYGFFIICCLFFGFWFLSNTLIILILPVSGLNYKIIFSGIIAFLVYGIICYLSRMQWQTLTILFLTLYVIILSYLLLKHSKPLSFQSILFFLVFFSVYATVIINHSNSKKEREKRKLVAMALSARKNPVTMALYEQMERKMATDSVIVDALQKLRENQETNQDSIAKYITGKYFTDFWTRFNVQVTCCNTDKTLQVQPQGYLIKCSEYFQDLINTNGETTTGKDFYFLDYGYGNENYLIVLTEPGVRSPVEKWSCIYLELSLKTTYKDLGYPELLLDKSYFNPSDFSEYAHGLFRYDRLVHGVGPYNYRTDLKPYLVSAQSWPFFSFDGMDHYYYRVNNSTTILVSKSKPTLFNRITPFSYLFILFSGFAFILFFIGNFRQTNKFTPKSIRDRLQLAITGILVLTFIIIGIVLILNITKINTNKNDNILQEKAFSVLTEVQHRYSGITEWQIQSKSTLNDFLVKLSNVFFTDINFYDGTGFLIATSRPQIFEEGLLSPNINPSAYRKLLKEKQSIYIHDEYIGRLPYSSAYIPVYNNDNQLLGFLNLPYFSRQDELAKEISTVLVSFTNIYILLILFGLFITLLISNYIVSPLTLLSNTMARLRIGRINEKISWKQTDEIGQLVNEYNRMVDALSQSAELLARSERENAWREMARQVAHEIKNPLTPMKLSVQYLQKAWNENAPDWDQRLERFAKTLTEQIDTLSAIASGFSDFAQMPPENRENLNLETLLPFVLSLYNDGSPIQFTLSLNAANPFVYGDRKQMVRVFTNLINNAIQSIENPIRGVINIELENEGDDLIVRLSDNGSGIPESKQPFIFQPNFTTKSGGMGLGLAIVKGIVEKMGGIISFHSDTHIGTTIIIKFPHNDP